MQEGGIVEELQVCLGGEWTSREAQKVQEFKQENELKMKSVVLFF